MVLRGSVPSTSPRTNSRPLISFCRSAPTVPYVLFMAEPSSIATSLSRGFRTSSFHQKWLQTAAPFTASVLASTRKPIGGGKHHDLDRQYPGGAGRRAACLFSYSRDVSLDQAAGLEDVSPVAREGGGFRGARRQSGPL